MAQKLLLCSLLALACAYAQAQQIKGVVRNHQQQPLAAAIVVLSVIAGLNTRRNRSGYTMLQVENTEQNYREKNENADSNADLVLQTDYVHSFSASRKLEAGLNILPAR